MNTIRNQVSQAVVGQFDIYIPRVNRERASFAFMSSVFVQQGIGYVEHIDFVEINANYQSTSEAEPLPFEKHPTLVSAFVKLSFWDKKTLDAIRNPPNLRKLYLYSDTEEHWLLLPNKTPIDRTILNIHQVAHYTAELQTNVADLHKTIESYVQQNKDLHKILEDIIQQNKQINQSMEMLIKRNSAMQTEIDELKAPEQSKTVISITHNARDIVARKIVSDSLCGNA